MEIDENDQHPPSSIIELRKALTMSTNPNQIPTDHFRPTIASTQYIQKKQMKEPQELTRNSCRLNKKLRQIDHNDRNPSNSIIELKKAFLKMTRNPNQIQTGHFHPTIPSTH